jgi:hypothetical protein
MAWKEGTQKIDKEKFKDMNKFFKETLIKDLDDNEARITLAQFLRYNLKMTTHLLTGIYLKPYQLITIRGWFNRNFNLTVWGRANGKSFTVQIFCFLYALFTPNTKILVVSQNFRSSRRILENIDNWSRKESGKLLFETFSKPMSKKADIYTLSFSNGSEISCVPLSNGEGLRGLRANVLVVDEGLLVPEQIIENVLKPFLGAKANITEDDKIREFEEKLIRKGVLSEADRLKSDKPTNKMIILSSASYTWEYLYKLYQNYIDNALYADRKEDVDAATYFVSQLSYEIIPPEILDKAVIDDIKSGNISEDTINREYKARFTDNSAGYFKAKKLKEQTIEYGMKPTVEWRGEKEAEYILAIDPSFSGSENSDHFAMSVIKKINLPDGRFGGALVHAYAVAGGDLKDHILYFKYLYDAFNPVYIIVDSTQGERGDFISVANESKVFKDAGLELLTIEADFNKEDLSELPRQVKNSYNRSAKRIVHKQGFSNSSFMRGANEWLQACLDNRRIFFASVVSNCDDLFNELKAKGVPEVIFEHGDFIKQEINNEREYAEYQDYVIDLTKREMALIVVKVSINGNLSYDLPQEMKKLKGIGRPRRDNYTTMMLGNWGLKMYCEAMMLEDDFSHTFDPVMV